MLQQMQDIALEPALFVAGVIIVLFPTVASIVVGLLIAAAGVIALRRIAEHDPQYLHVLYRRLKYGSIYTAVPLDTNDPDWRQVLGLLMAGKRPTARFGSALGGGQGYRFSNIPTF